MNKALSASLALDTCSAWGTNRVARLSQTYKGQHFGVWTRIVRIETMDRPKFLESKNRCKRAFDDLQILGGIGALEQHHSHPLISGIIDYNKLDIPPPIPPVIWGWSAESNHRPAAQEFETKRQKIRR